MRKAIKVLLAVVVLVVVGLGVLWLSLDRIAKSAIERGATYALGVPTTVGDVNLGLLRGEVTIRELAVANPEGFQTPHLMRLGQVAVHVRPGSLLEDTIEVREFTMDDLDLHLEQKVGSCNFSVVLANLKRFGSGEAKGELDKGEGKKVAVNRVLLRNLVAHVQLLPVGGKATTLTVQIPEIELNDVTDEAGGVRIAALTARLVPAILAAVLEKGKGTLPEGLRGDLSGQLSEATKAIGGGAARLVEQAGQDLEKTLKGIGKPLEGLLRGRKDAADKEPSAP